jgi:hypothetical protein
VLRIARDGFIAALDLHGFIRRGSPASDAFCRMPVRLAQGAKMTDAVTRETRLSGFSLVLSAWHDPAARILNVDLLTVLIALLLPWSDHRCGDRRSVVGGGAGSHCRAGQIPAVIEAPGIASADRHVRLGPGRHAVVGIALAALFAAMAASFVLNMMFVVISRTGAECFHLALQLAFVRFS